MGRSQLRRGKRKGGGHESTHRIGGPPCCDLLNRHFKPRSGPSAIDMDRSSQPSISIAEHPPSVLSLNPTSKHSRTDTSNKNKGANLLRLGDVGDRQDRGAGGPREGEAPRDDQRVDDAAPGQLHRARKLILGPAHHICGGSPGVEFGSRWVGEMFASR